MRKRQKKGQERQDWDLPDSISRKYESRIHATLSERITAIGRTSETLQEALERIYGLTESKSWINFAYGAAEEMVQSSMIRSARTWREAAKLAGGRKSFQIFQALQQEFVSHGRFLDLVQRNAELIRSVPTGVGRSITALAAERTISGQRAESLIHTMQTRAPGLTKSHARLIARTETAKTQAAIVQVRAQQVGMNYYVWRTSQDQRVRSAHKHMEGVVCNYSDPPSPEVLNGEKNVGHYSPGNIWNCLTAETQVFSLVDYEKIYRRIYSGQLIEIFTADSQSPLRITPNHPMYTLEGGWKTAEFLEIDDQILQITSKQFFPTITDPNNCVASIAELFSFFSILGNFQRGTASIEDFHGDGIANQKIDIISIESKLGKNIKSIPNQFLLQDIFHRADSMISSWLTSGDSRLLYYFPIFGLAPHSIMSRLCQIFSILFGSLGHSVEHARTAITWLQSMADQMFPDGRATNPEFFRNSLDTFSGIEQKDCLLFWEILRIIRRSIMSEDLISSATESDGKITWTNLQASGDFSQIAPVDIKPVRILDKRICKDFNGHIYNLQTSSGWYLSGNFITKNCRCYAEPIVDPEYYQTPIKMVQGDRIVRVRKREFMELFD